jgi:Endonuclease/Exonuclease/phosphatase family 2
MYKHQFKKYYQKLKLIGGFYKKEYNVLFITFNQGEMKDSDLLEYNFSKEVKDCDIVAISLQESPVGRAEKNALFVQIKQLLEKTNKNKTYNYDSDTIWQGTLGCIRLILFHSIGTITNKISTRCSGSKGAAKGGIYFELTDNHVDVVEEGDKVVITSNDVKLGFIATHLPSDPKNPESRDNCMNSILNYMLERSDPDIIYFGGDMNYRIINIKDVPENLKEHVKCYSCYSQNQNQNSIIDNMKDKFNIYNLNDQLNLANVKVNNYDVYEHPISFCPTCRYQESNRDTTQGLQSITDIYHQNYGNSTNVCTKQYPQPFDESRFPSWCDRVIILTKKNGKLKNHVESYQSHYLTKYSDHKSVSLKVSSSLVDNKKIDI